MKVMRTICILLGIFFLTQSAGCVTTQESTAERTEATAATAQEQAEEQEQPDEEALIQVGETGRTEDLEITISKSEKAKEWINSPPEGSEYVVVSLKITNISAEEQSVGASDFQFVNKSGSREGYARTTGVKADPDTFGAADIEPDQSFEGSLVFAVPSDMSSIELHYLESYQTVMRFVFGK